MFGLKGKTLLFFIVTTVILTGVGVCFVLSINNLERKIETRFKPKQQTDLLRRLTLDINVLNNQFLNDSLDLSEQYVDSIIENVVNIIDRIQIESRKIGMYSNDLDIIPKMLDEVKQKNFELKRLRIEGEDAFVFSLEAAIQNEFKTKLLSEKDSIVVTHQITSYIRENKLFEEDTSNNAKKNDRNFFQRLFKSKEKQKEKMAEDSMLAPVAIELDTTIQHQVDTIVPEHIESQKHINLATLYDRIQRSRINYLENIRALEMEIYELNYGINKKIESIINDFIFQQYTTFENYLLEIKSETKNKSFALIIVILLYTFIAIGLLFTFFRDINQSVEYQENLKHKEEEAKRAAEEKQRFLNTMSHEIRTPLTSIIGYADLIQGEDKNIKAIKSATNYLYQITNEILDIAKINMGIIEIERESTNLTKILEDIRDNFTPQIENKGLECEFNFPDYPVYIYTDGKRIQQILYNLLHNATKFTSEGFVNLKVEEKEQEDTYQLEFKIEDSGIGMDKEEQIQVFKDFHQTGTHKNKSKGTGLGLGIVEKLVHKLSGQIHLESAKGEGSTFYLTFIFDKVAKEELFKIKNLEIPLETFQGLFKDKSFIIVDDDAFITELYKKFLAITGAKVSIYNAPKKALMNILNNQHHLLIIDYKMPEMTGFEFLTQLQSSPKIELPKTIISTANAMLDEEVKKELSAFDKVIFKPIKQVYFLQSIADVLDIKLEYPSKDNTIKPTDKNSKLNTLKKYVGDEKEDIIEILELIVNENKKSLKKLEEAIQKEDSKNIAFIIHQLSSRFAQVDESMCVSTKKIAQSIKLGDNLQYLIEVKKLLDFWQECQLTLKQQLNFHKEK